MNWNKITKHFFTGLIFSVVAASFFACRDDNSLEQLRKNELALLDEYILANHPGAKPTASGLYYFEKTKGKGDTIVAGDKIQIFYATWTIDGKLIDETNGYTKGYLFEPLEFVVGASTVISGLEEAVTYMQLGTVAKLVINSQLAYGQYGNTSGEPYVAGFSTLLMEVKVHKIYKANK